MIGKREHREPRDKLPDHLFQLHEQWEGNAFRVPKLPMYLAILGTVPKVGTQRGVLSVPLGEFDHEFEGHFATV